MMDDLLRDYQNRYQQLHLQYQSGRMTRPQFEAEVSRLRWTDPGGNWWMIDISSGLPLRWNGSNWIPTQSASRPAQPLARPVPPGGNVLPSSPGVPANSWVKPRPTGLRARVAATPILALVPSIACGGLWFLYTFIGLFKSEGIAGLDIWTPIIVIGFPLVFWFFKKPIDQLLLPLKPAILRIPRPTRLGISLAVPLVLSCGCSMMSSSGYQALNVASFISILTAGIVMRY